MPTSERPGVYSSYEVTSALAGRGTSPAVGLAACVTTGADAGVKTITSYAGAVTTFGSECAMTKLVKILLQNGAPKIVAAPVAVTGSADTAAYTAAFALLMAESAVRYMVCDSRDADVHAAMKTAVTTCGSESCKYRMGFAEASGSAEALVSAAAALNSERMTLIAPAESSGTAGAVAAALAGCAAGGTDPALPFNGAVLAGLGALGANFTDAEINTLVQGGVTPVETVGGEVSVIRAVTTRTTTAGAADATWRELCTVLIMDDVITTVRDSLRARFTRVKNTAQTRGAIRTQVMIELENKRSAQIIESYGAVTAEAGADDPTVCGVSFEFTVAHGLNRINLVAHITV